MEKIREESLVRCKAFHLLDHFQNTLTLQMRFKHIEQRELLIGSHRPAKLQQLVWRRRIHDEGRHVDVDKSCHQELTVESVHDASVARDRVSEILFNFFNKFLRVCKILP